MRLSRSNWVGNPNYFHKTNCRKRWTPWVGDEVVVVVWVWGWQGRQGGCGGQARGRGGPATTSLVRVQAHLVFIGCSANIIREQDQRPTYQSSVCLLKAVLEPVDDAEVGVVLLLQLVHLAVQLRDLALQVGDHLEKCWRWKKSQQWLLLPTLFFSTPSLTYSLALVCCLRTCAHTGQRSD